jgi:hypothetical protein
MKQIGKDSCGPWALVTGAFMRIGQGSVIEEAR